MKLRFGWEKTAGLVAVEWDGGTLHFAIQRKHWIWGHELEPYDHCLEYYGAGPLFLLCLHGWRSLTGKVKVESGQRKA